MRKRHLSYYYESRPLLEEGELNLSKRLNIIQTQSIETSLNYLSREERRGHWHVAWAEAEESKQEGSEPRFLGLSLSRMRILPNLIPNLM